MKPWVLSAVVCSYELLDYWWLYDGRLYDGFGAYG